MPRSQRYPERGLVPTSDQQGCAAASSQLRRCGLTYTVLAEGTGGKRGEDETRGGSYSREEAGGSGGLHSMANEAANEAACAPIPGRDIRTGKLRFRDDITDCAFRTIARRAE
jgi:hypothetical protein